MAKQVGMVKINSFYNKRAPQPNPWIQLWLSKSQAQCVHDVHGGEVVPWCWNQLQ